MSEEKLVEELEKLTRRLFNVRVGTPMYDQLNNMLAMAQQAYDDLSYVRIMKAKDKDGKDSSVMNIGEIESETKTPDYSSDQLLVAVVEAYTTGTKK